MTRPQFPYIQPQMPHELNPQPSLGHIWKLTVQDRYGQDDRIDRDKKVWVSCTCGNWLSAWFADEEAALQAYYETHRPHDTPVEPGELFGGDDPGGRGAAEDAYQATLMDGHR